MKRLESLLVLGALTMAMTAAGGEKANATIAYVDLQKAINATASGKAAKESLTKEFERRKKEVDGKKDEIKKLNEDFEKKSMVMNDKAKQEKITELNQKFQAAQQLAAKYEQEMQEKQVQLTQPIIEDMQKLIEEIAKEKGYAMVLEKNKSAVVYAQPEIDVTSTLIEKYEKKSKKK
jgi:outer membrane protein